MNLHEFAKSVAQYAPLLGAALPIPGGQLLGQAIATAFGGDLNKPEDLLKKIQADPEASLKFLSVQENNKLEIEKLLFTDRQEARQRELDYIKVTGVKDYTLKNLAYITTAGFFAVLLILFMPALDLNDQEKNLIMVLLGMLASKWQTIIDYYFGASRNGNGNK